MTTSPIPCEHCCHPASFKVREQLQAPYRGQWQALVARVAALPPDVPVYRATLDQWLAEIADDQPDAAAHRTVNTTRYGREGESE